MCLLRGLAASIENLRLYYYEAMVPADYQDYFFYDQLNFIGAILYAVEPFFDLVGCLGEQQRPPSLPLSLSLSLSLSLTHTHTLPHPPLPSAIHAS